MSQSLSFKKWDFTPSNTNEFTMTTKFTDFDSPDGKKSILGLILNITQASSASVTEIATFNFYVSFRYDESQEYSLLHTFANSFDGTIETAVPHQKIIMFPDHLIMKNFINIQFKISGQTHGRISINDFGIIYRKYKSSNVNEDE